MHRRLARDSTIFVGAAGVMALLQVGYRVLAAGNAQLSTYGRVALVLAIFNALLVVGHFGVPVAAARLGPHVANASEGDRLLANALWAVALPCAVATACLAGASWFVLHSVAACELAIAGMPPMVISFVMAGVARGRGAVWGAASIQPVNALVQLIALATLVHFGPVHTIGLVSTFYIGNWGALIASTFVLVRVGRSSSATGKGLANDDSPPALLRFSAWLTLSSLFIYIVGLAPRVAFARSAYADVALVDLALLIYTLPQRFVASFVTALIPLASREDLEEAFPLPGAADLAIAAFIGIAAASVLWWTALPARILVLIGLPAYARAGSLFSIMAAAAPAELVYAYLGGLFQARGESRALARATGIGVAVSVPLILLASLSGVTAVAVAFAASYWGLALTLRLQYPRSLQRETEIARWTISRLRTRGVTA